MNESIDWRRFTAWLLVSALLLWPESGFAQEAMSEAAPMMGAADYPQVKGINSRNFVWVVAQPRHERGLQDHRSGLPQLPHGISGDDPGGDGRGQGGGSWKIP